METVGAVVGGKGVGGGVEGEVCVSDAVCVTADGGAEVVWVVGVGGGGGEAEDEVQWFFRRGDGEEELLEGGTEGEELDGGGSWRRHCGDIFLAGSSGNRKEWREVMKKERREGEKRRGERKDETRGRE